MPEATVGRPWVACRCDTIDEPELGFDCCATM